MSSNILGGVCLLMGCCYFVGGAGGEYFCHHQGVQRGERLTGEETQ